MTLQECYAAMEGDYADVAARMPREAMVQKFVLRFLSDDSFDLLCRSLEKEDYEEAFRAAHTIKGVCQNLSFTKLQRSSGALTEALRNGWTPEAAELIDQVKADYRQVIDAIQVFQREVAG